MRQLQVRFIVSFPATACLWCICDRFSHILALARGATSKLSATLLVWLTGDGSHWPRCQTETLHGRSTQPMKPPVRMRPHVPDANLTGVSRLLPGCLLPNAQVCLVALSIPSIWDTVGRWRSLIVQRFYRCWRKVSSYWQRDRKACASGLFN